MLASEYEQPTDISDFETFITWFSHILVDKTYFISECINSLQDV